MKDKKITYLPLTFILFGIVLIIAIFFSVTAFLKAKTLESMQEKMANFTTQTSSMMSKELSSIEQSKKVTMEIQKDQITWHSILQELALTIPSNIAISSFSGNNSGKITIQMVTNSMNDVKKTVELLRDSSLFKTAFVPSLSMGQSAEQQRIITFPIVIEVSPNDVNTYTGTTPVKRTDMNVKNTNDNVNNNLNVNENNNTNAH